MERGFPALASCPGDKPAARTGREELTGVGGNEEVRAGLARQEAGGRRGSAASSQLLPTDKPEEVDRAWSVCQGKLPPLGYPEVSKVFRELRRAGEGVQLGDRVAHTAVTVRHGAAETAPREQVGLARGFCDAVFAVVEPLPLLIPPTVHSAHALPPAHQLHT